MASYRELLRTPGVGRIMAAQLTARLPNGMTSLAILLHIQYITGSYGSAGLVLAATSVGQAVAGPITSRWMGRWGMRRVLTLTLIVCAAAIAALAVVRAPVPVYMALGLIAGLATPPVQSAVRTIYPKMVPASSLTPLFSLDASLQEIIWIVAPVVTTLVATGIGTVPALLLVVGILVFGGVWFILSPEVGLVRIPPSRRRLGVVLTRPPVILATVAGLLLVGSFGAVEVAVVATFGHGDLRAGLALAVSALGSLAGGLAFGHTPIGPWAMARRLLVVTIGFGLAAAAMDFWWISLTMLIAGVGFAPAITVIYATTSASVKFSETAEAFGWIATGQLIGAAAGAAVAGLLVDSVGITAAYLSSATFVAVGVLVSMVFVRGFPDLRQRDSSPIPDTTPIRTQR